MPLPVIVERVRTAAATGAAFLPVHAHFGVRSVAAEPGRVEVAQRMGDYCLDGHGRLSPGAFLVGADTALGSALASRMDDTQSVVSLTIHLQFVRLDPGAAQEFTLDATATHVGEHAGSAHGRIVDDAGLLVATMSTNCAFATMPVPPTIVPGWPIDPALITLADGRRSPDTPELSVLATERAGARITDHGDTAEGVVRVSATATPDMCNSRGDVQGGVLGLLVEQALSASLVRSVPALAAADVMDVDITYLRAVRPAHPGIELTARTEHAGRRFAQAYAVGRDDAGRAVVSASGSRFRG